MGFTHSFLTYLIILILAFFLTDFLGYFIHRFFHNPISGIFYRAHMNHHLKQYPSNNYTSEKYKDAGKDNSAFYFLFLFIPVFAAIGIPLHILHFSRVFILAVFGEMIIIGLMHDVIHTFFHIEHHWLKRFKIVEKLTDIHYVHHCGGMSKNFGIYSFIWDRLFGTFYRP